MGFAFFVDGIRRYVQFSGRATRQEFWMYYLWKALIAGGLAIVGSVLGLRTAEGANVLLSLFSLFVLVPSIAIAVRRLHDIGSSGWLELLELIPILGWLILVVGFWTKPSDPGANAYGPPASGPIAPSPAAASPPSSPS